MKKIRQGEYELYTTKEIAIDRFMQLQGYCGENSNENSICLFCSKKGKLTITNPLIRHKHLLNEISTKLFGRIIEKDGKTFLTFYTKYSKFINTTKLIACAISIMFGILAIILERNLLSFLLLAFCLGLFIYETFNITQEKYQSVEDSEIMIKALEKIIRAVNEWDK